MFLILVLQFLYSFRIVFVLFAFRCCGCDGFYLIEVLKIHWKNVCLKPMVLLSVSSGVVNLNADVCISGVAESCW